MAIQEGQNPGNGDTRESTGCKLFRYDTVTDAVESALEVKEKGGDHFTLVKLSAGTVDERVGFASVTYPSGSYHWYTLHTTYRSSRLSAVNSRPSTAIRINDAARWVRFGRNVNL